MLDNSLVLIVEVLKLEFETIEIVQTSNLDYVTIQHQGAGFSVTQLDKGYMLHDKNHPFEGQYTTVFSLEKLASLIKNNYFRTF